LEFAPILAFQPFASGALCENGDKGAHDLRRGLRKIYESSCQAPPCAMARRCDRAEDRDYSQPVVGVDSGVDRERMSQPPQHCQQQPVLRLRTESLSSKVG